MHRKSMEVAQTLNQMDDSITDQEDNGNNNDNTDNMKLEQKPNIPTSSTPNNNPDSKDDFRSHSIASLRAKAQEHSAKLFSSDTDNNSKVFAGGAAGSSSGGGSGGGDHVHSSHSSHGSHVPHHLYTAMENSQSVF